MKVMKCTRLTAMSIILLLSITACRNTKNISKVSVLSERKINLAYSYELKALGRTATAATIQEAVSALVSQVPDGLYVENAEIIHHKKNKITVIGDIWGISKDDTISISRKIAAEATLKTTAVSAGDRIQFININGIVKTGKVIAVKGNMAIVQTVNRRNLIIQMEIPIQSLKKY